MQGYKIFVGFIMVFVIFIMGMLFIFTDGFMMIPMIFMLVFFSILFVIIRLMIKGATGNNQELRCDKCGGYNPPMSKFCRFCGDSLSRDLVCEYCGHINDKDAAICTNCNGLLK